MSCTLRLHMARWFAVGCCVLLCGTLGCRRAASTSAPASASEVLERMLDAYRQAETYQDGGQVRLSFTRQQPKQGEDAEVNQSWDYSVALERPNKLRMHVYQAVAVCDGKQLHATLDFEQVIGQVLTRTAPEKLKSNDVYGSDPLLAGVLHEGGAAGPPVVLSFLLDDAALDPVLEGAGKPKLLAPEKIDEQSCYRVEVERPDGRLVFWVDQKTYVLRRLEYPTKEFAKSVEEQEGPVSNLSLVVELTGAQLDGQIAPAAFEFEAPPDARIVEHFMTAPALLGQQIAEFKFVGLDGKEVTRDSLAGKVAVLDFWATWCEPCLKSLPNLQKAAERYRGNDKVAFLAVSVDTDDVKDEQIADALAKIGVKLPVARDAHQLAPSAFLIEGLPTTVLLSPDGKVQDFEAAYNPDLAEQLAVKIEKILTGQNIYEETLAQFANAGGSQTAPDEQPSPPVEIAPRSEPSNIKLSPMWTCRDLSLPGNLLAITEPAGRGRLFALDGWRTVVEIGADGQTVAKHELDLPKQPEEAVVSFLRSGVDADGTRYFVGTANSVQQLFVFDADWKRLLVYPANNHPGITDAQVADLNGDGKVELCIGYWGSDGVECLALDGTRQWKNNSLENTLRLAAGADADGKPRLLATNLQGRIVPIAADGKEQPPLEAGKRFIELVFAADLNGDGQAELCGIGPAKTESAGPVRHNAVIGISPTGDEQWHYDLPPGLPANGALEYVTYGALLDQPYGQWVIAGADGSIHVLAADGKLIDRFNYGSAISGIAVARLDGKPALVVAGEKGIEAWTSGPKRGGPARQASRR